MRLDEYVAFDGIGLAELIARREVSLSEVSQAATQAIHSVEPAVNAVIEYWSGEIPIEAQKHSLLYGVPFLFKDLAITMAGKKNELGSRLGSGVSADSDSTLMGLFKAAGLVAMGRTTTPEFAISTTTEAVAVGATRNPWNPAFNSGGSSGGSGASVAAGMVPIAHATDGGGSIRVPASANGIFGLKPTRGRVSNGPAVDEVWSGLATQLCVSRTVRDTAAVLDAVGIPAPGEPYYTASPAETFLAATKTDPLPLKIGLMMEPLNGRKTAETVRTTINSIGKRLQQWGNHVEIVVFDPGMTWEAFVHANAQLWTLNTAAWIEYISSSTGRPVNDQYLERSTLAVYEYD